LPIPAPVERLGDDLLPGAALAGDENARVGVGDPVEQLVELPHGRAVADELLEALRLADQPPQALHLLAERAVLHGTGERDGERVAHTLLIVDDEDASAHDAASFGSAGGGRKIENRLPLPTSLSTSIQPPCSATMPCATASPSPVPSPTAFVVKKGSKTRARCSRGMPVP